MVSTIYFGGGTPSLLSPLQVNEILSEINKCFKLNPDVEITIEANPGTIDAPYLKAIRNLGINRLSIGFQSLDKNELALLGRIHSPDQAKKSFKAARKAGFSNINVDLIYGLPLRLMKTWQDVLKEVVSMSPEHLSLYALTLEKETPLYLAMERGEVAFMDSNNAADEYEFAEDYLSSNGYKHYEISNWAKPGFECRQNLTYWKTLPYAGFGVAAHSYLNGHRFSNTIDLDKYLNAFDLEIPSTIIDDDEEIGSELQIAEAVILGLRLIDGIDIMVFNKRFNVDLLKKFNTQIKFSIDSDLLEVDGRFIRLTRRGRLLGNEVFWRFLPE